MRDLTFYLDGVDAADFGIVMQGPVAFEDPVPVIDGDAVNGRNGDLLYYDGSFENRGASVPCYALNKKISNQIAAINKFLLSKKGYRRLETSDDPDHYWLAAVMNGAPLNQISGVLNPFEIEFDCKPQRFRIDGEQAVSISSGGSIDNPYGFASSPIVRVTGAGRGVLNIGAYRVDILEIDEHGIILDSDTMNAYNVNGNQNNNIKASEFPLLVSGQNTVSYDGGITGVEIVPRWWEL